MEETVQPAKRKPASKQQIEKDLKLIYNDEDGKDKDFSKIERVERRRRWPKMIIAAVILFGLAYAAWSGVMRFGGTVRYGDNVSLEINGPAEPCAGDAQTWTIRYRNNERLPLARASVSLNLPASFALVSSDPALPDPKSLSWPVGTLASGESGTITVVGRILDALDAPIAAQSTLSYRPSNFNADFQKVANWSSKIFGSAITAALSGPDEAVPGDDQAFTLTVKLKEELSPEAAVPDLRIRFDPDQLIIVKNTAPAFSTNDARTWLTAAPGKDKPLVFAVAGAFATNTSGNQTVRAEVGTIGANGNFLALAKATLAVNVLPGDLVLSLIRNGSVQDSTVALGAGMHVSIDYENQSKKPINNAEISLTIHGSPSTDGKTPVNWATLDDIRGGKRSGETITWTKKEIPELASIAPGAKGSIDINFKTVSAAYTENDGNYGIDLSARGTIGSLGDKKSNKTVSTPVMRTLINSDTAVSAAAALVDGTLQAGQSASYRIVWVISNSLHPINGLKVTAPLPAGVSFAGKGEVNYGDIGYDSSTNSVAWTLNMLPTSVKNVSADFTVSATPGSADAGKILPLLGDSILTATDKSTNASLAASAAPLDTSDAQGGEGYTGKVAP